jgi:hypothetical protein
MSSRKRAKKIQQAVENTPDIKDCFKEGLSALGVYSQKINLGRSCDGSVYLDKCVREKYPQENRWDYLIGYQGEAIFIAVHSAYTSEVKVVLKKLAWLKLWIQEQAPDLEKLKSTTHPFIWIASGRFNILPNSPQYRQIIQMGLKPISELKLD